MVQQPTQQIRRSQFILSYGPGSILDSQQGPRVVLSLAQGLRNQWGEDPISQLEQWEVQDSRVTSLLDGGRMFQLPTNALLNVEDSQVLYKTRRFPFWAICPEHQILYRKEKDSTVACPRCRPLKNHFEADRRAGQQAVRFVSACPQGHLSDVPWVRAVHGENKGCQPTYLKWKGGGSGLKDIVVSCPNCKVTRKFSDFYYKPLFCQGYSPEHFGEPENCQEKARVFLRRASNIYLPEVISALTIPPRTTPLHNILEKPQFRRIYDDFLDDHDLLEIETAEQVENLISKLEKRAKRKKFSESDLALIKARKVHFIAVLKEVLNTSDLPVTHDELLEQEYRSLKIAAHSGAPPRIESQRGGLPQFEVRIDEVRHYCWRNLNFRVTPIRRLRVVLVQKGYRRLDQSANLIEIPYRDDRNQKWFPAAEMYGEGIFIDLPHNKLTFKESLRMEWQRAFDASEQTDYHFDPYFVWWHSLSHRLIRAFSVDSGYSSASIRERIYRPDFTQGENDQGGILLYTAQPGGDGTLGGLMTLAQRFDMILQTGLDDLDICSNDPLCGDNQFAVGKHNGSACYACLLVSETSCEHRNMFLDRTLLQSGL